MDRCQDDYCWTGIHLLNVCVLDGIKEARMAECHSTFLTVHIHCHIYYFILLKSLLKCHIVSKQKMWQSQKSFTWDCL